MSVIVLRHEITLLREWILNINVLEEMHRKSYLHFKKINYFTNSVLLTQDSKNTRSYSQLLHANDAQSSIDLKQASRKHFLLQQQKMFDNLNIVNKKNIISVSNFNVSRKDTKRFTFLSREFQRLFGRLLVRFFFQVGHL